MSEFRSLNNLDRTSLVRLADLLEAKLLVPPFGELTMRDHIGEAHVSAVSEYLAELSRKGVPPSQIAMVLRAFAAGREVDRDSSDLIDVVVTGPDAIAASRDTGVVMRQLFNKARDRVLAVGFAIHQGRTVFQTLADRLDECESLEVILCVDVRCEPGSTTTDPQIVRGYTRRFMETEWPGTRLPRLYYDPRSLSAVGPTRSALHAKCVVVDGNEALVTSANFTEAAQVRNIELGLHVSSPAVARQIEDHFHSLIRNGHLERAPLTDHAP